MSLSRKPLAVGYIRVSKEDQVENHSLSAQRREIEMYCESKGFELIRFYADEGVSAHVDDINKRPQLAAMLRDAEAKQFDHVIVHTLDRFARNIGVQRQALSRLGAAGVGFASRTEDYDFTTPAGKFMLTAIGGVAELFSDQLAAHVKKGLRERARSGFSVGPVPFGYVTDEETGIPMIVDREAEAVRSIFGWRASGDSQSAIAERLNAQGLKTRKGRLFTSFNVKDMLKCDFYRGVVRYGEEVFPGKHEAIVSDVQFERIQVQRLQKRRASRRSRGGAYGALRKRAGCANCGMPMHSERNHSGLPLYRERHGQSCPTDGRSIAANLIDGQMGDIFRSILLPESWQTRLLSLTLDSGSKTDIEAFREKKRRVSRAYAMGGLPDHEYDSMLKEIEEKLRSLERPLDLEVETAAGLFSDVGKLWDCATQEEREKLIAPLLDRVYVDIEDRRIEAIEPAPAFKILLDNAIERSPFAKCVITGPELSEEKERGSVWWRRGRVGLPVQV